MGRGLSHQVPENYDPLGLPPSLLQTDVCGLDVTRSPYWIKINIPTVHIYGIKGLRYMISMQLAQFCAEDKRKLYDHGGRPEIPRRTKVSEQIAELLRWLQNAVEEQELLM